MNLCEDEYLMEPSAHQFTGVIAMLRARKALLSSRELCSILGVHTETLYAWVQEAKIPSIRIGRNHKFDPAAIAEWLAARTTSSFRPENSRQMPYSR